MSTTKMENEVTVYAKIMNPEALNQATRKEDHVQVEAKLSNGARTRVRKVTSNGKVDYISTLKTPGSKSATLSSNFEAEASVTEEYFNLFSTISERTLVKTRYSFVYQQFAFTLFIDGDKQIITIPEIVYEVDVFTRDDGEVSQWCKIDVELDAIAQHIKAAHPDYREFDFVLKINHLPFHPTEAILSKDKDPAKMKIMSDLWENEFIRRKVDAPSAD